MPAALLLFACCAGAPLGALEEGADEPRAAISMEGVQLRLPTRDAAFRAQAQHVELARDQRGFAQGLNASSPTQPGLEVTSKRATWDMKRGSVLFEGEVRAVRGEISLRCQTLQVSFSDPQTLEHAVAEGDVEVRQARAEGAADRVAQGARATLDVSSGRLELTGDPQILEGGRRMRGERIVLFLDDERLECEACSLVLPPQLAPATPDREGHAP